MDKPTPDSMPLILKGDRENRPPRAWTVVDAERKQSHVIIEGMNIQEAVAALRALGLRFVLSAYDDDPPPNS